MTSKELFLSTGTSLFRDSLGFAQTNCLSFPILYSLKPVLTFSYHQYSLLLALFHPTNESVFTLVTTYLLNHLSQHLTLHPVSCPSDCSSQFPEGLWLKCGASCASVLFLLSHLILFLGP